MPRCFGTGLATLAGGRVLHVTDNQGLPPVVAEGGGSIFAIDPYLAKIGGRWAIVR